MSRTDLRVRMRPEVQAGDFPRDDETMEFYMRVGALIRPDMTVVDVGAGRGARYDRPELKYPQVHARLQGRVAKVIGLDVDPALHQHPHLDERHIIVPGQPWPLADSSVDLLLSEWVFEHIEDPASFVREVDRVLKPGGWVCAITPNKWSYVALGARLVPESLHRQFLSRLWPQRRDVDAFPTFYRLNTRRLLREAFPPQNWTDCSYVREGTPKYHGGHALLYGMIDIYQKIVPSALKTNVFVFMQKRPDNAG